jgi:hypothetical protein
MLREAREASEAPARVDLGVLQVELPLPSFSAWGARVGLLRESHEEWLAMAVDGELSFGEPLRPPSDDSNILVPASSIEPGERLYRVIGSTLGEWNIEHRDLLVVEPRPDGEAANGEFVVAEIGGRIVVGRWWAKNGRRQVLSVRSLHGPESDALPRVIGAITTILRDSSE